MHVYIYIYIYIYINPDSGSCAPYKYMCFIIYYGNINKDPITLRYFLLYYDILTHSYCVPALYLLIPTLAMGAPHLASCVWPYTILTHLGCQIVTYIYIYVVA